VPKYTLDLFEPSPGRRGNPCHDLFFHSVRVGFGPVARAAHGLQVLNAIDSIFGFRLHVVNLYFLPIKCPVAPHTFVLVVLAGPAIGIGLQEIAPVLGLCTPTAAQAWPSLVHLVTCSST